MSAMRCEGDILHLLDLITVPFVVIPLQLVCGLGGLGIVAARNFGRHYVFCSHRHQ